jgi:serine O-acetyltransferase
VSRDCVEKLEVELKALRAEVEAMRAGREPAPRSGTDD